MKLSIAASMVPTSKSMNGLRTVIVETLEAVDLGSLSLTNYWDHTLVSVIKP